MIMQVLHWPDARLSAVCSPIAADEDLRSLAADMLDTMYHAPGRGLAAPQVGVLKRLFVMDTTWKDGTPAPRVCLNPVVIPSGARVTGPEGCLSLPGIIAEVERAASITLFWTGLDGIRHRDILSGFDAICAQHELDHLDGIVTLDRIGSDARAAALAAVS